MSSDLFNKPGPSLLGPHSREQCDKEDVALGPEEAEKSGFAALAGRLWRVPYLAQPSSSAEGGVMTGL